MAVQNPSWKPDPKVIDELISGLRLIKTPDSPTIPSAEATGKIVRYSPNYLIGELRRGSELGRRYYRAYFDLDLRMRCFFWQYLLIRNFFVF